MSKRKRKLPATAIPFLQGRVYSSYVFDATGPDWDPSDNIPVPEGAKGPHRLLDNVRRLPGERYNPLRPDGDGDVAPVIPLRGDEASGSQ